MASTMHSPPEKTVHTTAAEVAAPPAIGHMMAHNDPDSPQNFPLHRKIYVSAAAFAFGFVVYELQLLRPIMNMILIRF